MKGAVIASTLALCLTSGEGIAVAQSGGPAGAMLSMDITIARHVVDAAGRPVGPESQTRHYRLSRIKTTRGWKTTMVLTTTSDRSQGAPGHPFDGGRLEFDEDGGFHLFDNSGTEVNVPAHMRPSAQGLHGDWNQWLESTAADAFSRRARIAVVRQRYGAERGQVGSLTRYVHESGDMVEELLFDSTTALPMQINVVQTGELKALIAFRYAERAGGGLIRRGMRSEMTINEQGHRAITETEFSNVVVEGN